MTLGLPCTLRPAFQSVDEIAVVIIQHKHKRLGIGWGQDGIGRAKERGNGADLRERPEVLVLQLLLGRAGFGGRLAPGVASAFIGVAIVPALIGDAIGQAVLAGQGIAEVVGRPGLEDAPAKGCEERICQANP